MIFKLFIFLLPLVFLGCGGSAVKPSVDSGANSVLKIEMVWDGDSKSIINKKEYDEALKKYVELKYPKKVKAYKQKTKKLQKEKATKRKKSKDVKNQKKIEKKALKEKLENLKESRKERAILLSSYRKQRNIKNNTLTLSHVLWEGNKVKVSNLMWQDSINTKIVKRDWKGAREYCKNLDKYSFSDWRLATKYELISLYKKKKRLKNITDNGYWSSSVNTNSKLAYSVGFYSGKANLGVKNLKGYVRCVRKNK